jgi:hypothetical protein
MSSTKQKARPAKRMRNGKRIKVGDWNKSLKVSDVNQIWTELHRIVSSHPLVRASKRAGFLVEEGKYNVYTDMTQELFVALLTKERFQHYLDEEMSDAEIEAEISQIELTNLLTAQLRKRHPESYRLARRISTLIQNSDSFKRFDNLDNPEVHRRLADRVYGLAKWKDVKTTRNQQEWDQRVKNVAFYNRDTRMVGCTGAAQIVISKVELEKLHKSVRGKAKQYNRMINILWHCYLVSDGGTQLEVADKLGVSDSLVSDYRKRIEANLQELSFGGVNEARQFEKVLKLQVKELITVEEEEIPA